jgi:hypothetical protein
MENFLENENYMWYIWKWMEDGPFQVPKENASVQTKRSENPKKMKKKWNKNLKNCMHKDYFGNYIAKMHYAGHFFVLMITKKLI